jgi:hypothetical protein
MNTCTIVQGFVTKIGPVKQYSGSKYADVEITTSGAFLEGKMIGRPHTHRVRFGSDKMEEFDTISIGSFLRVDCYSNPVIAEREGEKMLFEYLRFKRFKEVLEEKV